MPESVKPSGETAEKPPDGRGKAPGCAKGQFGRGRPVTTTGPVRAKEEPEVVEGQAAWLAKMRKVWGQASTADRGQTERRLRDWLKAKPKEFFDRLMALEAEVGGQKSAATQGEGGGESDPKAEKVYALVDELLAQWEGEKP